MGVEREREREREKMRRNRTKTKASKSNSSVSTTLVFMGAAREQDKKPVLSLSALLTSLGQMTDGESYLFSFVRYNLFIHSNHSF